MKYKYSLLFLCVYGFSLYTMHNAIVPQPLSSDVLERHFLIHELGSDEKNDVMGNVKQCYVKLCCYELIPHDLIRSNERLSRDYYYLPVTLKALVNNVCAVASDHNKLSSIISEKDAQLSKGLPQGFKLFLSKILLDDNKKLYVSGAPKSIWSVPVSDVFYGGAKGSLAGIILMNGLGIGMGASVSGKNYLNDSKAVCKVHCLATILGSMGGFLLGAGKTYGDAVLDQNEKFGLKAVHKKPFFFNDLKE